MFRPLNRVIASGGETHSVPELKVTAPAAGDRSNLGTVVGIGDAGSAAWDRGGGYATVAGSQLPLTVMPAPP